MHRPPLTSVGPAGNRLNDTTTMPGHTLSSYCNSWAAKRETWKETEQGKESRLEGWLAVLISGDMKGS